MNITTTSDIYLSKKGMKELQRQVERLERDMSKAQADLRELDKTEGHEERLMRVEKLAIIEVLESELADKKFALEHAKLLPRKRDAFKVALGSVVELIDTQGRRVRYMLVDSLEADPSAGRISIKSPLGQNLLGRQIHDIVQWSNGLRSNQLRLVGIA
jgi:transcription elongation factor GreA